MSPAPLPGSERTNDRPAGNHRPHEARVRPPTGNTRPGSRPSAPARHAPDTPVYATGQPTPDRGAADPDTRRPHRPVHDAARPTRAGATTNRATTNRAASPEAPATTALSTATTTRSAPRPAPDPAPNEATAAPRSPRPGTELGFNPNVLRVALAILVMLLVVSTGAGWATRGWLDRSILPAGGLDRESPAIRNAAAQVGDANVLVLTTDFPTPGGISNPSAGNVLVAHVPAGADTVVVLSLPSDTEINRPPCERWDPTTGTYLDRTVPAEARTTLISAFEIGGPRCTTRVVQQSTGLAITAFVALDRAGVATTARAAGVDPCPQGPPPATDLARVQRDQQVLAATLGETLSWATLLAPPTMLDVHSALPNALFTDNISLDRLLGLAQALSSLDADGVTFAPTPTTPAPNRRGHTELRDGEAAALFKAVREDTALPPLDDPRAAASSVPSPADITVDVFNASGRDGLAKNVAERLGGFGFAVDEVGNAEDVVEDTVITFSPDRAAAAEQLASALPGASLAAEPGSTAVLKVTLGRAFDNIVQAPGQANAPVLTAASSGCQ